MSLALVHFITATSTDDIQVTGGIENRKTGGVIQIGNEKISFTAVSHTGFLNVTRGAEGTSATSHETDSLVTVIEPEPTIKLIMSDNVIAFEALGAPTDHVTGRDKAGTGSLYSDRTNGKLYINGGTKALPVWKIVTSA
jgi:hypothetical protein